MSSIVSPEDTVPCKVQYQNRKHTDIAWGVINFLAYVAFLATGFYAVSKSHPRHQTLPDGSRGLSEYYFPQAETCCASSNNSGYACWIYEETLSNGSSRRLAAGNSTFDGDEGIFDAFIEAPEIIVGLLSTVLGVSLLWIILLRFFAKPIVILVEILKIALLITVGVYQKETSTKVIVFLLAALMVGYLVWQWKTIIFAAKMITHSTISLKENPSVLIGSLAMKLLYAGNAAVFVLFFAKSYDVVEIKETEVGSGCYFVYPDYMSHMSIFWSFSYLWTILLFGQMRLSVIATLVGSWYFHPEDKPSVFKAIANVVPSYGTLSVSSLIATIAEKINRKMSEGFWKSWISPFICVTFPLELIFCIFGSAIQGCVRMLTNYAVVLHVFTGEAFVASARNSFKILSRHFKNGFVTEYTSRSLFNLASYAFSFCVALVAWVWIDGKFNAESLPGATGDYIWILWFICIFFNVYYPILGIYILIFLNRILRGWERDKLALMATAEYSDISSTNHMWIPPLAATFVGCLSMMFFTFLSHMFLDIITTLFLCFAIDKDNNVDTDGKEFASLVKEMPGYIAIGVPVDDPEDPRKSDETPVAAAFPVQTY